MLNSNHSKFDPKFAPKKKYPRVKMNIGEEVKGEKMERDTKSHKAIDETRAPF